MSLNFSINTPKELVFEDVAEYLHKHNIKIVKQDDTRPWGGFFVLDESFADKFIALYFPHLTKDELNISGKLSPKILVVAPNKRLSWQYHHRRAEIWKLIGGIAGVITSDNDEEKEKELVAKMSQLEDLIIPDNFNYDRLVSLSNEARQKFLKIKPRTLGQASRISGVNPSDVQILMVFMGR